MIVAGSAWRADRFGAPTDVLAYQERQWGQPPPGVVLVEVLAAGVGLPDLLMVQGSYPMVRKGPITPGQEVCGRIVATAKDSRFAIGDRICGTTMFHKGSGGFATHSYVTEAQAMAVPPMLSDEAAGGFSIGFSTAHTALVIRCQAKPGESVLVLGGSGGTGAAAVSLAKALGLHVVAVASTETRRAFCTRIGADEVIDRSAEAIASSVQNHTAGNGFDVVIDPVGGDLAAAALQATARYGRFAAIGFASGTWVQPNAADMAMRNYSVVGVLAAGFSSAELAQRDAELTGLAEAGSLQTPVGAVYSLAEVPAVVASLSDGAQPGKLIINCLDD